LYAYRCTQCGHKFEKIQNFSAEPESECPQCHGKLERPLTAPRLNFKGAGWYVNDYAGKGGGASSDSSSGESKSSETKTESATPAPAAAPAAAPAPGSSTPTSSTTS